MPFQLLLLTVLSVMMLLFEITLIPASPHELPEFVILNLPSLIPSAESVITLLLPPASTTGLPIPVFTPCSLSRLVTFTFS